MEIDIYLRASRKGDERQRPIEGQEIDCRARVREIGATVGQVHADRGRSAWNPRVRRAGWSALMERLENGTAGGVVVFDLERFSRQPIEGERLLSAAGNGLRVLDSDSEYDLTSPSGRKAFRDHMAAAAYFSDRLSSRTRRGKRVKAQSGEVDRRRSFGFEADGTTIRESEAEVIRELAARLLAGEPQDSLMRELNERGVRTSYGNGWERASIRQLMTRPRNGGYIVHSGEVVEGVRLPEPWILEESVYRRIIALYAARKPGRPVSGRYVLTGFAVCGLCGHGLNGKPRKNHPYKDGTVRRQYWCSPATGGCGRITVDSRELDTWAGDFAIRELRDPRNVMNSERAERERAALISEMADIESTLNEIAGRLGRREPGWTLARHDAVCEPLEKRIAEIQASLADAEPEPEPEPGNRIPARDQDHIAWLERWDSGDVAERRAMVRSALRGRRIVIGPGQPSRFDPERVHIA